MSSWPSGLFPSKVRSRGAGPQRSEPLCGSWGLLCRSVWWPQPSTRSTESSVTAAVAGQQAQPHTTSRPVSFVVTIQSRGSRATSSLYHRSHVWLIMSARVALPPGTGWRPGCSPRAPGRLVVEWQAANCVSWLTLKEGLLAKALGMLQTPRKVGGAQDMQASWTDHRRN